MITKIAAKEILDSRGNPTIEVEVHLENGVIGRAAVPAGASTGAHEALELRDHDPGRYGGLGVLRAVENVAKIIASELVGKNWDQMSLDKKLIELDGTPNKSRLGANAILGVSLAFARATAKAQKRALYLYLQELSGTPAPQLPVPMFNILNGGRHAENGTDIQEFMIVPTGAPNYSDALRYGLKIYEQLKKLLLERSLPTALGDEGGFVLIEGNNEAGLKLLVEAIEAAQFKPGQDVGLALDVAASEFYESERYNLTSEQRVLTSAELINQYENWLAHYPIISIEDGLAEDDWTGWQELTKRLGNKIKLVGDDLFVTNPARLQLGIDRQIANAILIKPNQIGTLSETLAVSKQARAANYEIIISHRSGETEDSFIADLAVGVAAPFIKAGAPATSERLAKYNRLSEIARELEK